MANKPSQILIKRDLEMYSRADALVTAKLVPDTIMLEDFYDPCTKHTPDDKILAVTAYMVYGASSIVEKKTGISAHVIRHWKNSTDWWIPTLAYLRKNKQDELDSAISRVIDVGITKLEKRLREGDEKLMKDGTTAKVAVSAKDLAYITSIMVDKRNLMRGDPTSRTEKTITNLAEIQKTLINSVNSAKQEKVVSTI